MCAGCEITPSIYHWHGNQRTGPISVSADEDHKLASVQTSHQGPKVAKNLQLRKRKHPPENVFFSPTCTCLPHDPAMHPMNDPRSVK